MNRIRTTTIIGALIFAAGTSTAVAQESGPPYHGWYIGAAAGSSDYRDAEDADFGRNRDISDDRSGYFGLFGGYRLNDYVSAEVGYRDLGEVEALNTAATSPITSDLEAEAELITGDAVAVGHLPVWRGESHAFSIVGKAGGYVWKSDVEQPGPNSKLKDDTDVDFTVGGGLSWDTSYATLELTYRFYNNAFDAVDVSTVGANFVWRFQ